MTGRHWAALVAILVALGALGDARTRDYGGVIVGMAGVLIATAVCGTLQWWRLHHPVYRHDMPRGDGYWHSARPDCACRPEVLDSGEVHDGADVRVVLHRDMSRPRVPVRLRAARHLGQLRSLVSRSRPPLPMPPRSG